MKRYRLAAVVTAVFISATQLSVGAAAAQEPADASDAIQSSGTSVVTPEGPLPPPAPLATAAQRDELAKGLQDRREAAAAKNGGSGGGIGTGADHSRETNASPADSEALSITRNNRNTRSSAVSSTLAEPAAANDFTEVLYGGNTYFSRSGNSGLNWAGETIAAGPADAPFVCCDFDVVHHGGLDTTFAIALYLNSARTNGVIRIFVRRGTIVGGNDCTYLIDPGGTGTLLPDYPHIATSNGFLYLTTQNLNATGTWVGSQVRRFNATQMANCTTSSTQTMTYTGSDGQRILTPVENASTTQYFGLNRTANTFRILRWPESSATLSVAADRSLPHGTAFVNSDCRGGSGNFDFIERGTSWNIAGFRLRGAVVPGNRLWFTWNAGSDSSHPQAHLHSAILTEPGLTLLSSPPVFNSATCFGYPTLGANAFGEFGITLAFGGKRGGAGSAAQGAVAVDDASSTGNFFPSLGLTASGTHNRSDSRYGDYFTMRRNDKCPAIGWVATNYALLNGNTSASHVNARYIELQSNLRAACP